MAKAFKPCSACPSPAKCKAAGKCMAKKMSKGGAPKGPSIMIAIAVPKKAPAKKGKNKMPGQRFKQVPEMYKGKPVEKLTMKEREQMFKDLGYDAPEFKKGRTVPKGFNEEPDMGSAKKKMAVGGMPKKQAKVATVMKEYKAGKLKSSSGQKVTKPKQAVAIALSEAGMAKKKKAKK